ncbi:MAG TPA: pilin [bacterium]|nr:pilin [bacterium]
MMKKYLFAFFAFVLFFFPFLVGAAGLGDAAKTLDSSAKTMGYATGSNVSLEIMIGKAIQVFLGILGVIFLGITVWAGFQWMTAGGNTKKIEEAKGWLMNGVIGLVIILSAYAISSYVVSTLVNNLGTIQ